MLDVSTLKRIAKARSFRLLAVLLIVLVAIPEATIALDLFAALDIMGAELFLMAMWIGIRMLPWWCWQAAKRMICRVDPYFFVPERHQLRQCPALAAHAVPLFVPVCLAAALWSGSAQPDA